MAVIGLGRMGAAMARRIAGAGHPLTVWNRDPSKAESVAADTGATIAGTAAEAASRVDVVITSLADDAALRAVYLGHEGVVAGLGEGTLVLDTSTVDPGTAQEVGDAVDSAGGTFLDCPVSGSVTTVEAGALVVMAGGDADAVARAEPVLAPIAKSVVHCGGRGAGAACKLAVNGLVHGINVALSESLVLAEMAGVDRETAYEVFASGAAGAPFVAYKRDAFLDPDSAPVAFSLDLVAKDLDLITELAARVGVPMGQAVASLGVVRQAIDAGMGDRDMSAVAVHLRAQEG